MKTVHGWAYPDADQFMAAQMSPSGEYQADHLAKALSFVTDFSCAIDGGAHVGTWARLMAKRFTEVIAVEPSADSYQALLWNLETHNCANVVAKRVALGSRVGRVAMRIDSDHRKIGNTGAAYITMGDDVSLEPIDLWELPSLGFVKLDIEGSEFAALAGAIETLRRCRPVVLFENKHFGRRYGLTQEAPRELLTSLGYGLRAKISADEIWTPR